MTFPTILPGTTTLSGTLLDQPWNYPLGSCIDALSGRTAGGAALEPFALETNDSPFTTSESYSVVSDEKTYMRVFETELAGGYNMGLTSINASASFMSSVQVSENSLTIIVIYNMHRSDYPEPAQQLKLKEDAEKLATGPDSSKFRETYGDYYVASYTAGARFVGEYICTATNSTDFTAFKAKASGTSDIMTASGSAAFSAMATSLNITVLASVDMTHVKNPSLAPTATTPAGVVEALAWFKDNVDPGPLRAELKHFSQLVSTLPNTIPIGPDAFTGIQLLASKLVDLNLSYTAACAVKAGSAPLPWFAGTPFKISREPGVSNIGEAHTYLQNWFVNGLSDLSKDPTLAEELNFDIDALRTALNGPLDLISAYDKLTAPWNEPQTGGGDITFGITSKIGPLTPTLISASWDQKYKIGHRDHDFNWPFGSGDNQAIITGWGMVSNKGSNGSWSRNSPLIGKSNGGMNIHSEYDRGFDWTWNVYYVPMSSFPWLSMID